MADTQTHTDDPKETESWTARDLAVHGARLVDEKQGEKIVVMHVGPTIQMTDYFVITKSQNRRHLNAVAEHVSKSLKKEGLYRMGGSSVNDADWVLFDFGAVVLHAFSNEARGYYDLDNLWGDCETVDWRDESDAAEADSGDDD